MTQGARLAWWLTALTASAAVGVFACYSPRVAYALGAYAGMLLAGWIIGRVSGAELLLPVLVLASVVAPRVVEWPDPPYLYTTGTASRIGVVAFAAIGAALVVAKTRQERHLIVLPAALTMLGAVLVPDLLRDGAFGWLSAAGALFVLGRHWKHPRPTLLAALVVGVASIHWQIPGYRAVIAILPSGERSFGVFGNSLMGAICVALLAAAVAALWWDRSIVVVAAAVVAVIASVEAGSRTGLVMVAAFMLATIVGLFPHTAASGKPRVTRGIVAAVVAGGAVLWFNAAKASLGRAGSLSSNEGSTQARLVGIRAGLDQAFVHPFGGEQVTVAVNASVGYNSTYENMFLDLGARDGWLPLAGLAVACWLMWRAAAAPARVVLGVFLAVSMTSALYYYPAPFIVAIVVTAVVDKLSRPVLEVRDDDDEAAVPVAALA